MPGKDDFIDGEAHTMEFYDEPEAGAEGLEALPGLARIAANATWRTTGWAMRRSVNASRRLASAATNPREAIRLADDVRRGTESALTDLLNATDAGHRVAQSAAPVADVARRAVHDAAEAVDAVPGGAAARKLVSDAVAPAPAAGALTGADAAAPDSAAMTDAVAGGPPATAPAPAQTSKRGGRGNRQATGENGTRALTLQEQGELLMRHSRDVRFESEAHPAYARILSELAPDEGRILRLLLLQGPQASVDVRTGGPLGLFSSRLIAPGISMIGARAGCRYVDRVPSYLNNLFRLGLVWFSRETIRDHLKYQVLEAQPEVLEAVHSVSQAKMVRRSIHLTPFGEDFCRTCIVPGTDPAAQLPAHSPPPEDKAGAQPPNE